MVRALRVLERAEIALLLIDAVEGMTDQDARIASYAWERGRALLLVFNKWDAVPAQSREKRRYLERLRFAYPTLANLPALFVSAHTGGGMRELFPAVEKLTESFRRRVRTVELNQFLAAVASAQAAPSVRGKAVRFFYATQTGTAPPVITIFASHPESVPASYQRYLMNELRRSFDWQGIPIEIRLRSRRGDDDKPRRKRR